MIDEKVSRKRASGQDTFQVRLRSSLDGLLSRGDIWLLFHQNYPFVVLKGESLYEEALALSADGRSALRVIGEALSEFSEIQALIAGHVDPCQIGNEHVLVGCHEAWQKARLVEDVLVATGVDPDRVLSVGVTKNDWSTESDGFDECLPAPPDVVTICFRPFNTAPGKPSSTKWAMG